MRDTNSNINNNSQGESRHTVHVQVTYTHTHTEYLTLHTSPTVYPLTCCFINDISGVFGVDGNGRSTSSH